MVHPVGFYCTDISRYTVNETLNINNLCCCDTEQFSVAAIPQTSVPEMPHSNLCQDTGCPERFPGFSSVYPDSDWNIKLDSVTALTTVILGKFAICNRYPELCTRATRKLNVAFHS